MEVQMSVSEELFDEQEEGWFIRGLTDANH